MPEIVFDGLHAWREHLLLGLASARRQVSVYDRNLVETGLAGKMACTLLQTLLQIDAPTAVRIVLLDTDHVERECPRLLRLAGQFSHRFGFRVAPEQAIEKYQQPFLLVDDDLLVLRFHHDNPRGKRHDAGSADIARYREAFEELWQLSAPGPSGTPLGL